jgi:hypothetical protein
MARSKRLAGLLLTAWALSSLLAACGGGVLKIGWRGFSDAAHKEADYVTFDGLERHTLRLLAGQLIRLDCTVTVEKGAIHVSLVDPDGESLWERTFEADGQATLVHRVEVDGNYTLRMKGDQTGGSFDVSWRIIEEP